MILPDANLLVYAVNRDALSHGPALRWLDDTLRGDEPVGFAWSVLLAFVRITTHARLIPSPLAFEDASSVVDAWLDQPVARIVQPTERHWSILKRLLGPLGAGGNLTMDAHLAALAIEHGAAVCSADNDFARFAGLQWRNPLASSG